MGDSLSNQQIVRRCLQNDPAAWETLVRRFRRLVYGIARRAGLSGDDAADVFQSVFTTVYVHLDRLEDPDRLAGWISAIARREAWSARRRQRTEPTPIDNPGHETAADAPLPDEVIEWAERVFHLHAAIERLDGRCRRLLESLFFRSPPPSYDEVAADLGIAVGSVGPTRLRCLEKLRRVMETGS